MYPIKMKISGIRDFLPREMDLGEDNDHILIGGKNGSGKSTLVYAMSYSLVSARVDIDGLRSKNLKRNIDPWRAYVSILFRNPAGESQCDAPEYVELSVEIKSVAGRESIKSTYTLNGGDLPDKLIRLKRFPSNEDAQAYYKRVFNIDADGYFMFWHQGAIARFANMTDQERFKQVAEMFGLDEIQQEWLEAQKQMIQAEDEFSSARHYARVQQRKLQELETRKNILEQRNNDRKDALVKLTAYFIELADLARNEWKVAKTEWDNLTKQYETAEYELAELDAKLKQAEEILSDTKFKQENLKLRREAVILSIKRWKDDLDKLQAERNLLNAKIADIRERMQGIRRSKDDLLTEKGRLQSVINIAEAKIVEYNQEKEDLRQKGRDLTGEVAILKEKLNKLDEEITELMQLDENLRNEVTLTKLATQRKEEYDLLFRQQQNIVGNIEELTKERERLNRQKTLLLPEQEEILTIYRQNGIEAVAFGELFEAKTDVQREVVETIFTPLKHTVFVTRILKEVPLNKAFYLVPIEDNIKSLPDKEGSESKTFDYLQMVPKVRDILAPEFLMGIKLWLKQIVFDGEEQSAQPNGKLSLWQGGLWDSFGVRGPVEPGDAIGIKALENARGNIANLLSEAEDQLKNITIQLVDAKTRLDQTTMDLNQRLHVNTELPVKVDEFEIIEQQLPKICNDEEEAIRMQKDIDDEILKKRQEKENADGLLKQVNGEIAVYEEYEQQSEDIEKVVELEKRIGDAVSIIEQEEFNRDDLTDQIGEVGRSIPELTNARDSLKTEYIGKDEQLDLLETKKSSAQGRYLDFEDQAEQWESQFEQLQLEYEVIINDLRMTSQWIVSTVSDKENKEIMERRIREAKNALLDAVARVVDERALENYDVFFTEFELATKQMLESELRFENLKKEEERRRDKFNKAVYMRWERTNQHFGKYIQHLGMVGHIRSIPPDENERNPQYKWELHVATQVGHKPEKVEPESTKRVGKGISGGERAATSLIFALALLSDIENKPPFYVLDEFDSALDEERKHQLFDMYQSVLNRKLIIASPKIHGDQYLNRFGKFHCVVANPSLEPGKNISEVYDVTREQYLHMPLDAEDNRRSEDLA